MGRRMISNNICSSEDINTLSWYEEVFFYRLIANCDDYGRFDGRAKVIRGACFPLRDVTDRSVDKALSKLSTAGMVRVYETEGKAYLELLNWEKYQTLHSKTSRYPAYEEGRCILVTFDSEGKRSRTQEVPQRQKEVVKEKRAKTPEKETEPAVITLLLNSGEEYPVTQSYINELSELYPAVDILQELRGMKGWCNANPSKRKTLRGIKRFITSWIARRQDRGNTVPYADSNPHTQGTNESKLEQFAKKTEEWANG